MPRCLPLALVVALALTAALVAVLAFPAHADVSGTARVVDGDTLEIAGERIRLHGIDAPEKDQTCSIDGRAWACGIAAWGELVQITAGKEVACEPLDTDRYGRTVAACSADGTDLGDWLVRNGWAVAYYLYSYAHNMPYSSRAYRKIIDGLIARHVNDPFCPEWGPAILSQ